MQELEYRVLVWKPRGFGGSWTHGERDLGQDLEAILNEHARSGWVLDAYALNHVSGQAILRRPFRPGEVVPAAAPEGRGDEVSAGG